MSLTAECPNCGDRFFCDAHRIEYNEREAAVRRAIAELPAKLDAAEKRILATEELLAKALDQVLYLTKRLAEATAAARENER